MFPPNPLSPPPSTPEIPGAQGSNPFGGIQDKAKSLIPGSSYHSAVPDAVGSNAKEWLSNATGALGRGAANLGHAVTEPLRNNPFGALNKAVATPTPVPSETSSQYKLLAGGTQNTPPLSRFTSGLGSFAEPINGALGLAQKALQNNPGRFAALAGTLGGGLVKPILGTPFGLPIMAGLHGLLSGGESAAGVHAYLQPLLDRLGINPLGKA